MARDIAYESFYLPRKLKSGMRRSLARLPIAFPGYRKKPTSAPKAR